MSYEETCQDIKKFSRSSEFEIFLWNLSSRFYLSETLNTLLFDPLINLIFFAVLFSLLRFHVIQRSDAMAHTFSDLFSQGSLGVSRLSTSYPPLQCNPVDTDQIMTCVSFVSCNCFHITGYTPRLIWHFIPQWRTTSGLPASIKKELNAVNMATL